MPIVTLTPPRESLRELEFPAFTHAHPVYALNLTDILAGKGVAAATLVSWRYLQIGGAAEVNTDETQSQHAHALINEGSTNQATLDAIRNLEQSPAVAAERFELRLLRIPALMTVAVWLHAAGGSGILMAIPPATSYFGPGAEYSRESWESRLLRAAREMEKYVAAGGLRSAPRPLGDSPGAQYHGSQ